MGNRWYMYDIHVHVGLNKAAVYHCNTVEPHYNDH